MEMTNYPTATLTDDGEIHSLALPPGSPLYIAMLDQDGLVVSLELDEGRTRSGGIPQKE